MPKMNVDWNTITNFVIDAFVGYGVPHDDAVIIADVLLESDKRGIESHGCNRFKGKEYSHNTSSKKSKTSKRRCPFEKITSLIL